MKGMNSSDIEDALADKFAVKHVIFTQVKNGPSWGGTFRTADFMAIKKTWSPITITACEIKISRSDFTHDHKWVEYLPMCNQFFWACPKGLIKKDEVDPRCGLIWVNDNGTAHTAKTALHRDVPPDPATLLYLLLWRMDKNEQKREAINVCERVRHEIAENAEMGKAYENFVATKLREADVKVRALESAVDERTQAASMLLKWMADNHVEDFQLRGLLERALLVKNAYGLRESVGLLADNLHDLATALNIGQEIAKATKGETK